MKPPILAGLLALLCLAVEARGAAPQPAVRSYGREIYRAVAAQIADDAAHNAPLVQHYFGVTGTTMEIAFIVTPSGQVARDRILSSSGNQQFDAIVLHWTGTMKLPPFPPGITDKQMTFAVPYFFRGR